MKKICLLLFILTTVSETINAQTSAEWFQQKKTQKKYLIQQIAALQVYLEYGQKGYKIAKEGLTTISGLTKGELNLHGDYFNSLKKVNPQIKQYAKVADIVAMQVRILQEYKRNYRQVTRSNAFNEEELDYIRSVFERLLDDCGRTLDELTLITTNGQLEMEDHARIARIDKLYLDVQDQYTFSQKFSNELKTQAISRIRENTAIQTSRVWQGIKK